MSYQAVRWPGLRVEQHRYGARGLEAVRPDRSTEGTDRDPRVLDGLGATLPAMKGALKPAALSCIISGQTTSRPQPPGFYLP